MPNVQALPRGRIGREVLALLMGAPGQQLHTREIARRVSADAHPVQRALEQLLQAGILESRRLGNLRLWSVNERSQLVPAVRELLRRTAGVAERLRVVLSEIRGIHLAFLFGSYAAGEDRPGSDIDLFVVGTPDWDQLSRALAATGDAVAREINPVVWRLDELERPTPMQQRFLSRLLRRPRIWILGDDDELERIRAGVGTAVVRGEARPPRGHRRRERAKAARSR
jgi:predicted nucleotidyltransferase